MVTLALALPALAQAPTPTPFPGQPLPGRNVPPPSPPPAPQFEFSIPAPQRGPVPRAVDEIQFDVSDIKIVGAKVFTADDFKPLIAPLIGHKARLSDIIGVADKIEDLYREHGYVLTRAFVPPQTVANGVFQINVVEGYVKATAVSGGDESTRRYVEAYVAPVTQQRPATLQSLEGGLLLANGLPGVTASGVLRPSPTEPGASDLVVDLTQSPWDVMVYGDNRGSKTTNVYTVGFNFIANNLIYIPGQAMFDVSGDPGFSERQLYQARYSRPIGYSGATLDLTGNMAHGVPAAASGSLVSDSYALGAQYTYPLVLTRPRRISIQAGANIQGEKVSIPGLTCTSSDDRWRTVSLAGSIEQRGLLLDSNSGLTLGATQGIPVLGAESSVSQICNVGEGASTGFTKYTFVATHDQPIIGPFSASFRSLGQWTTERLVIGEQTSFGGSGIGRGYDPASLAADVGYGVASELRYDTRFPEYRLDNVEFYAFLDFARVRYRDDAPVNLTSTATGHSLLSTGVGVRLSLLQSVSGGVEFAQELRGVANNNQGRTGSRILFNVAVRY
jgi:hemolysin activation/secretion protein